MSINLALHKCSSECIQQRLPLCKKVHANCTSIYEEGARKLLSNYVEEGAELQRDLGSTPLEITTQFLLEAGVLMTIPYSSIHNFLILIAYYTSTVPSIEPFAIGNLIQPKTNKEVEKTYLLNYTTLQSLEKFSWGIVKSDAGSVGYTCSSYKDMYMQDSEEYLELLKVCRYNNAAKLNLDLLRCAYTNRTSTPVTWATVASIYFHSQCLCLAYNGTNCGVKAPQGVDPRLYCFTLLLRDFQRQVSYRPAVTYLDYAFKTRVSVCQFANLVIISFQRTCGYASRNFTYILPVQCYFKNLVNKHLNCSETMLVNTFNETELCSLHAFMQIVLCDGNADDEFPVAYYRAGDSLLLLFLTSGDIVARVLTLVTYMACPQLRNLPGKLLIGYLMTALLRLLAVRATIADLELAVRLDVATDLASTLWLFSNLHFITVSIRDLRPPDTLSTDEARMVLFRYSLLGWVLPAALSAAFFCLDEAIDSHVQIGQLLFLLCNYVTLFGNLFMCFKNCSIYYEVKNSVLKIKRGATRRDVYTALFNFAIKTSVLSGVGITFRLIFTQIQGLEQLLGYYHALGTLQGLLVFLLYGCNREARAFWLQLLRSILHRCPQRQNAPG